MMRLVELNDLHDQAVRHALIAERTGFPGTAKALMSLARDLEGERRSLLVPPGDGRPGKPGPLALNWSGFVAGA